MAEQGGELRKAQRIGSSIFISLPKDWAQAAGVGPGDVLELTAEPDGSLRVKPIVKAEKQPAAVKVEQPLDLMLPRALTCLYILGYEDVVLELPATVSGDVMASVREALSRLPGFEVVEVSGKRVRVKCLTSAERISSEELLRRYLSIVDDELIGAIVANVRGEERRVDPSVVLEERKLHSMLMKAMVGSWRVRTPLQAVKLVAASLMEVIADFMLAAARKSAELDGIDADFASRVASTFEDFGKALSQLALPLFSDDREVESEGYLLLNSVERRAAELLARSSGDLAVVIAKLLDSARIASFIARMAFCAKKYYKAGS